MQNSSDPSATAVALTVQSEFPLVELTLPGQLTQAVAEQSAVAAREKIESLAGNPFGLLIDTRKRGPRPKNKRCQLCNALKWTSPNSDLSDSRHVIAKKPGFTKEKLASLDQTYAELGLSGLMKTFF